MKRLSTLCFGPLSLAPILLLLALFTSNGVAAQETEVAPADTVMAVTLLERPGFFLTRGVMEDIYTLQQLSPVLNRTIEDYKSAAQNDSLLIAEQARKIALLELGFGIYEETIESMQRTMSLQNDQMRSYEKLYKKERGKRRVFVGAMLTAGTAYLTANIYSSFQ